MKEFVAFLIMAGVVFFASYSCYDKGREDTMRRINKLPSAMDVYQGKTTLQYTIIDDVKIDSVVVFK